MAVLTGCALALNSGSSSLKFALFSAADGQELLLKGEAAGIGMDGSSFHAADRTGRELVRERRPLRDHRAALERVLEYVRTGTQHSLQAVGHRLVRGGIEDRQPLRITPELLGRVRELIPFLPDHLPQQVAAIEAVQTFDATLPQVACFDTAFHRTMPRVAQIYGLPREFASDGILRFGYHGLSYEFVVGELAKQDGVERARGRVVIAHLGSGCSMAAIHERQSVDTTMGFSPTGGLVMSTRSGDLDPEVVLYLLQRRNLPPAAVSEILNHRAGLAGVSGGSSDMRDLLAREALDPQAAEAVELFCYQARKFLGSLAAVLGGIDTLVFTAGIGENSPPVRRRICEGMGHLGLILDRRANDANAARISAPGSPVSIRVIPTNEELMIARHTLAAIRA